MRAIFPFLVGLVGVVAPLAVRGAEPPRFEFKDGDRVVLVGDTLVERDQRYGYLETMLTLLNPAKGPDVPQPRLERRHGRRPVARRLRPAGSGLQAVG